MGGLQLCTVVLATTTSILLYREKSVGQTPGPEGPGAPSRALNPPETHRAKERASSSKGAMVTEKWVSGLVGARIDGGNWE